MGEKAVRTRFAPSPTGYLHIGGARTALFAWAFARRHGGAFFLRVEDTDAARSEAAHSAAIVEALEWLGLETDAPPVFQSAHRARHEAAVRRLLDEGRAYRCYATPEELAEMRVAQAARGENPKYDRRWRYCADAPPPGVAPAVRFKMPLEGETAFCDAVKGELAVANAELDDFVIARADGSPTYNLAAVVDDVDMGITHVIRGDDHVMNTYRQWHLFAALGGDMPVFAHLPMILCAAPGEEAEGGARYVRMSKRYAAVDIGIYRREGFLSAAMVNYLARLSWGHGDAEVFGRDFLVANFSLAAVSRAPARFDLAKLKWLNREHLRDKAALPWWRLRELAGIGEEVGEAAVELIRERGDTLVELRGEAGYFERRPTVAAFAEGVHVAAFAALCEALAGLEGWEAGAIKQAIKQTAKAHRLGFGDLGMPMRLLLTGRRHSPDVAAVAVAVGREEAMARLLAGVEKLV